LKGKLNSQRIVKIGIVVDKIEEVARRYNEMFELTEEVVVRYPDSNKASVEGTYKNLRGVEVQPKLKSCIVNLEPVYLEIVEPYDKTPSPWLEYLEKYGSGVCFISFYIEGFKQQIDFMEQGGYPMYFIEEKLFERYAYFETQNTLGVTLELKERQPLEKQENI